MNKPALERLVCRCLDDFYSRRINKLSGLKLKDTLKRKNPYLFRAVGTQTAAEIVGQLLTAYMSSSDEGIFGDAFFEPLAKAVSGGVVAPSEGVDVAVDTKDAYTAIAVKSGPSVFNAQSRKRQNQDFQALQKRMLKLQKHFEALVGYCYGNKKTKADNCKWVFRELAGQSFWMRITGDEDFYMKIIDAMRERPEAHRKQFNEEWGKAVNRFTGEFIRDYCNKDGSINWHTLVRLNSGIR
ncbi:MAG TPA: cytoplasmic protein [Lentisphaeria bacterium]|nr:MAG: cytoplasmic protein [Lentisphaerae bacterium GWF2_50_93]HCE44694.1 cytoplasmic protein [Lentisphaeria bacterium]